MWQVNCQHSHSQQLYTDKRLFILPTLLLPYFPAHMTHRDFSTEILEKNNERILILVFYWKKTGLSHTKISNHNILYSSQEPRKSSSLPLKSSSWLYTLDASLSSYKRCTGIYKFGNNTYPRCIRRRSNLGHIFWGEKRVLWAGKYGMSEYKSEAHWELILDWIQDHRLLSAP